jgi:hypothetical protein
MKVEAIKNLGELPGTRMNEHNGYLVEFHIGKPYMNYLELVIEKAVEIKSKVFKMEEEVARDMMQKHMRPEGSVRDFEIPSIMFFLQPDYPEPRYVGYATHRMFMVETSVGSVPFVYVTRTIEEEHQGKHLGRYSIKEGLIIHDKAKWLGYRTQSPPAAYSTMQANVFKEGRHFPWEAQYNSEGNLLAHQIAMWFYYRIRKHGSDPDLKFGVSRKDYDEENKAYKPNPKHKPTMEIKRRMEEEFGMVFSCGDSLYGVGELK